MKHKTLLLVACILTLFAVQQALVGAETFPKTPVLSPLKAVVFSPPQAVSVTYYQLDPGSGVRLKDPQGKYHQCFPKKNNNGGDYSFGCTEDNYANGWYYPYPSNPYSDPIETDYLPNVLAREMDANTYPNTQSQAAMAVAARTFAYFKGVLKRNYYAFDNSASGFQMDVPYAFNINLLPLADRPDRATPPPPPPPLGSNLCGLTGLNAAQQLTCDAINGTQGLYLSKNGDSNHNPIDAEYHSDIVGATISDTETYLIRVEDPISTGCDAVNDRSNGWGMSQKGAVRWIRGNQCAVGGDLSTAWTVKWGEYRQILAHFIPG